MARSSAPIRPAMRGNFGNSPHHAGWVEERERHAGKGFLTLQVTEAIKYCAKFRKN
jgi:hypothetical protein